MKRALLFAALVGFGACGGYLVGTRGEPRPPAPVAPGTPLTVVRPTGETVTMSDGKNPVPKTETVRLVVYRVQGGTHHSPPVGTVPWQITIGGATVYAVPE